MSAPDHLPDNELIELLKEGDRAAYTVIFHRYKTILYKHAYKILGDYDVADDIVQELFLSIWMKRDHLHIKTTLNGYLYSAIRNRIFNYLSHEQVASKYVSSIQAFVNQGQPAADESILAKELARIIEKEIAALPAKMREVFELSRREDLSYKEIGEQLGITEGTVKLQVHNATKILRLKINSFLVLFPFL